jgi:hypothetical protein
MCRWNATRISRCRSTTFEVPRQLRHLDKPSQSALPFLFAPRGAIPHAFEQVPTGPSSLAEWLGDVIKIQADRQTRGAANCGEDWLLGRRNRKKRPDAGLVFR